MSMGRRFGGWLRGRWVWPGPLLGALSVAMIVVVGSSGLNGDYAVASTGVPAAPSGLTASWSGSTISLSWDNPGDNSIDKYQYQITTGRRYSDDNWIDIDSSGHLTTSHTINGVTGLRNWKVHLRSHNSSGNSAVVTIVVAPVPMKFVNSGTGKCLDTTPSVILQWACHSGSNQRFWFYPISGMSGFFQIKSEGKCVEESSTGSLVAASCAVRAQGEMAAVFEARLLKQAFQKVAVPGASDTYTLRRKGVSGSCWTVPGTVAAPPRDGTQIASESCSSSWGSQHWVVRDVSFASSAVKLLNSGTGKCLGSSARSGSVFQSACVSVHSQRFRLNPISGMSGFFQVENVGMSRCVEESSSGMVAAQCAVRARGESAAAFEARLLRQAFGFFGSSSGSGVVASSYAVGSTYTLRRKGVSGSCWTVPGTVAAPPRDRTGLASELCDGSWGSQRWVVVGDVKYASPAAVKLLNSGTGKCLDSNYSSVFQSGCESVYHQRFRFYPISGMSGFFQVENVGMSRCVEESSSGMVAAQCAVRARGESAAAFEVRLLKQAFQKVAVSGASDTYMFKRKGVSGSCWTMPGTVAAPPRDRTGLASELCDGSWGSQRWVVVGDVKYASPAAVKLLNSGTGKCLDSNYSSVFQSGCESVYHQRFRLNPISGMSGFFQVENVGVSRCVEESSSGMVAAQCAVRARGESAAAFETRLLKQAFQKVAVPGASDTYTFKRKGVSGSCWTMPGTVAAPPRYGTGLASELCDGSWDSQRWVVVGDVTYASPAAVKLENVGTGKCLDSNYTLVFQATCGSGHHQRFRFYPISGMSGFFQVESVGMSRCVEESSSGMVAARCAVRARGESASAFEARLLKQAFQKVAVSGASDTYTLRRKGVSGSCLTVPGTVAAPPWDGIRLTNASCDGSWDSQSWTVRDVSFIAPVAVRLENVGTGKCLFMGSVNVYQRSCVASSNLLFRFYPISGSPGFFQIEVVGRRICVEESAGLLVKAACAVRARGESASAFEARLSRQAFGFFGTSSDPGVVASSYAVGSTYTLRRKGVSGSCLTVPGTVAAPPWDGTELASASCDGSWDSQSWTVRDASFLAPVPVRLENVGTGKCLAMGSAKVFQWTCFASSNLLFRFYPISGSPGFFQVEGVGRGKCVEESAGLLVTAACAVRARGESASAFEARLSRQAFGFFGTSSDPGVVASSYAVGSTYTLRRKGVSGSCLTVPGTVTAPPRHETQLANASCDGSWGSQSWTVRDASFMAPVPVRLENVGTGKCLGMGSMKVFQWTCFASSNLLFRFYPISGSPGFFQVEGVGRGLCVEESAGLLVSAVCAVRARGESASAFEARLSRQAFGFFGPSPGPGVVASSHAVGSTYTLRRKGASSSCLTVPGTVTAPPRQETQLANASCDGSWGSQSWTVRDASFLAPVPVRLENVGTGKCLGMGSAKVFQWTCVASSNLLFRFYPISGSPGFFQVEGVGRGKCVEESAGLLVTAACAVRARGESASAFEARLSRQAFGFFGPSPGPGVVASSHAVGSTYTLRRKGVSGSCLTVPGTVTAPPRRETQLANASCDGSWGSQSWTVRDASFLAPVPVKLENVGTGKCLGMGSVKVFQRTCVAGSNLQFRFYPISGSPGFFQLKDVGSGRCVEESAGLLVAAACAVRARGESASAFEARLSRQAFGFFGPSPGPGVVASSHAVGSTYTLRRKGASSSCLTVPGTVTAPPRDKTQLANRSCDSLQNSLWTLRDASYTTTTTQSGQ